MQGREFVAIRHTSFVHCERQNRFQRNPEMQNETHGDLEHVPSQAPVICGQPHQHRIKDLGLGFDRLGSQMGDMRLPECSSAYSRPLR